MHETGATERDFALAAVRDRRNAVGSSHAALTRPITVDDVLGSPPLCTPLKLLDAPVSLDGAAAVVLVSERVARTLDVRPVWLTGLGEYHDDSSFVPTDGTDKPIAGFVSTTRATAEALEQAGIGLDDVDVAEIYAPFSSHELIIPEDMGFFGRGGMVEALATGATEIAGRIPINTDGGLLARGHPWAVTPFYETITIVRQIRGVMGASQVEGARTGLVHTEAGMLNDALVLILQGD